MTTTRSLLALAVLCAATALSGCTDDPPAPPQSYAEMGFAGDPSGEVASLWPDIEGGKLVILDHGAFSAFDDAASQFENLTGVKVQQDAADDALGAMRTVIDARGDQVHDVIYGLDNALLSTAIQADVLSDFKPQHSDRVSPGLIFFDEAKDGWKATPVDHGYIAINWDPREDELAAGGIDDLAELRNYADLFVTQDPRESSPGLGFFLVTVATYGDESPTSPLYSWHDYWRDLLRGPDRDIDLQPDGKVLVTPDWTTAYEQHFTAGYGSATGEADRPIVTSYTTSPAYESYFGRAPEDLARVTTSPGTTWHQTQTMAILDGAANRAAAEAWIEFTLTDYFQELAAPANAVYPVVASIETDSTYGDVDPDPATLQPATLLQADIDANLERWLKEWGELYECAQTNSGQCT